MSADKSEMIFVDSDILKEILSNLEILTKAQVRLKDEIVSLNIENEKRATEISDLARTCE